LCSYIILGGAVRKWKIERADDVWGPPVGVLEMPDGSLLVSDDGGKKI
jgi:glucose/arabinose dehydrogenase